MVARINYVIDMYFLRPRTHEDCVTVVSWVPDADALYLFTGPRLSWPLTVDQLSSMEESGLSPWMFVEDGKGGPLGHFDLVIKGEVAKIGRVLIDPEHRGRGLARELINLAIDQARLLGASELQLNVIAGNEPAVRTYLHAGFTELPQVDRPGISVMRRPL